MMGAPQKIRATARLGAVMWLASGCSSTLDPSLEHAARYTSRSGLEMLRLEGATYVMGTPGDYPQETVVDGAGPAEGTGRVKWGGSWGSGLTVWGRLPPRGGFNPITRHNRYIGFRIARYAD